ncbi:hypothetical protein TUM4644_36720 [Shewanella colwelliana]|nr:hypothetical protein TUM4644_36720 [Shewanella colwelliana]
MKNVKTGFNKSTLALGIVAALSIAAIPTAQAVSFDWGEVQGSFDSTWSAGASWRVEERNWNDHIGKVNHPRFDWSNYSAFNNTKYTSAEIWAQSGVLFK